MEFHALACGIQRHWPGSGRLPLSAAYDGATEHSELTHSHGAHVKWTCFDSLHAELSDNIQLERATELPTLLCHFRTTEIS